MKHLIIKSSATIKESLLKLEQVKEKCLIISNKKNKLLGTLTDGDIRRAILNGANINSKIKKYSQKKPYFLTLIKFKRLKDFQIAKLIKFKKRDNIDIIPVVNNQKIIIKLLASNQLQESTNYKSYLNKIPLVIMAGGKGTRLKPFTDIFPKALIPIGKIPAVEHIIENFMKFGVKKVLLTVNYKKDLVKSYFKQNKFRKLTFIEEKKPLGTAGALKLVGKKIKSDFFVSNCDTICKFNLSKFYDYHKKNKYDFTIVVASKHHEFPYGSCVIDKKGKLKKIIEKPSTQHLVNIGLYLLRPNVVKLIPHNKYFDMDTLIKKIKEKKFSIGVFPVSEDSWIDIGEWSKYSSLNELAI